MTGISEIRAGLRLALRPALLLFFLLAEMVLVSLAGTDVIPAAVAVAATAATGVALVGCSLLTARSAPVVPHTLVRTALRECARRTAFLPQRDPDAAGRIRPRAPGRSLPTAA